MNTLSSGSNPIFPRLNELFDNINSYPTEIHYLKC